MLGLMIVELRNSLFEVIARVSELFFLVFLFLV